MPRSAPYFPTTHTGDGATKEFTIGWPFLNQSHVRVILNGVLQTMGTHYNITDPTSPENAKIKFAAAPTNGHVIKVLRNTPIAKYRGNPNIGQVEALQAFYRMQERQDRRITLKGTYGQTALLAGTALSFEAPCDGYIEKLITTVMKAVTTGGAVTVEIDGVAVTGLTVTVADSAAVGTVQSDTPTTAQSATTKVRKGQTITVTPAAAFDTAGDLQVEVEVQPADLD